MEVKMNIIKKKMSEVPKEPVINPLFTGHEITRQALLPDSKDFAVNIVNFGKGLRNKFHAHDTEQVLIVTAGKGAGGGSSGRAIHVRNPQRRAGFEAPGYARVELVGEGSRARLVASLHRLPPFPLRLVSEQWLAARWSVDREGRAAAE